MDYHVSGAVNGLFFLLALAGLVAQLRLIRARRAQAPAEAGRGYATAVLSLNQFGVSFLGYFAFFVYGYSVEPFNHYLVWPRLVGSMLVLVVLFELARDRRDRASSAACGVASVAMSCAVLFPLVGGGLDVRGRVLPQALSVVATALIVQGFAHQILLIRRSRSAGAISLPMHLLAYAKDLSTFAFGAAMGVATGWPLLLMGGASVAVKSVLLWQIRWARRLDASSLGA